MLTFNVIILSDFCYVGVLLISTSLSNYFYFIISTQFKFLIFISCFRVSLARLHYYKIYKPWHSVADKYSQQSVLFFGNEVTCLLQKKKKRS